MHRRYIPNRLFLPFSDEQGRTLVVTHSMVLPSRRRVIRLLGFECGFPFNPLDKHFSQGSEDRIS